MFPSEFQTATPYVLATEAASLLRRLLEFSGNTIRSVPVFSIEEETFESQPTNAKKEMPKTKIIEKR